MTSWRVAGPSPLSYRTLAIENQQERTAFLVEHARAVLSNPTTTVEEIQEARVCLGEYVFHSSTESEYRPCDALRRVASALARAKSALQDPTMQAELLEKLYKELEDIAVASGTILPKQSLGRTENS